MQMNEARMNLFFDCLEIRNIIQSIDSIEITTHSEGGKLRYTLSNSKYRNSV